MLSSPYPIVQPVIQDNKEAQHRGNYPDHNPEARNGLIK